MVSLAVGIHDSMQFMHVYFVLSNSFAKVLRNYHEMQVSIFLFSNCRYRVATLVDPAWTWTSLSSYCIYL